VVLAVPATVVATRGSLPGLVLAQVLIGIAVAGVPSRSPCSVRLSGARAVHRRRFGRWHHDCVDLWNRAVDRPDSRQVTAAEAVPGV
jgi:hypothetical protein